MRRGDFGSKQENEMHSRKRVKVSLGHDCQELSDLKTMKTSDTAIHIRKKVKTDQTLEVKETSPISFQLGSSGVAAPTSQIHETVEIPASGPTTSSAESTSAPSDVVLTTPQAEFTPAIAASETPDIYYSEHKAMVSLPTFPFLAETVSYSSPASAPNISSTETAAAAVAMLLVPNSSTPQVTTDSASALDNSASDVRILKKRGRPLGWKNEESGEGPRDGELREHDMFLPINNISKVMKKVVPQSGKVAKEARECIQECVSEFISFITRYVLSSINSYQYQASAPPKSKFNVLARPVIGVRLRRGRRLTARTFCLQCRPSALTTTWIR